MVKKSIKITIGIIILLVLIVVVRQIVNKIWVSKSENSNNNPDLVLYYQGADSELALLKNDKVINRITLNGTSDFGSDFVNPIKYNKKHNYILTTFYLHSCSTDVVIKTNLDDLKSEKISTKKTKYKCGLLDSATNDDYIALSFQNSITFYNTVTNTYVDKDFPQNEILHLTNNKDIVVLVAYNDFDESPYKTYLLKNNQLTKMSNPDNDYSVGAGAYEFYKNKLYLHAVDGTRKFSYDYIYIYDNSGKYLNKIKIPFKMYRMRIYKDKMYLVKGTYKIDNVSEIEVYNLKTGKLEKTNMKHKENIWQLEVKNGKIYAYASQNDNDGNEVRVESGYFEGLPKGYLYVYDANTYKLIKKINVNTKEVNPNGYLFSSFAVIDKD